MARPVSMRELLVESLRRMAGSAGTALELALFYGALTALLSLSFLGADALKGSLNQIGTVTFGFLLRAGVLLVVGVAFQLAVFFIFARRVLANTGQALPDWRAAIRLFVLRYFQVVGLLIFAALLIIFFMSVIGASLGGVTSRTAAILLLGLLIGILVALLAFFCAAGPMLVAAAAGDDKPIETCWRMQRGQRPRIILSLFLLLLAVWLLVNYALLPLGMAEFDRDAPWTTVLLKRIGSQTFGQLVTFLNVCFFTVLYQRVILGHAPVEADVGPGDPDGRDGEPPRESIGKDEEGDHQGRDDDAKRH